MYSNPKNPMILLWFVFGSFSSSFIPEFGHPLKAREFTKDKSTRYVQFELVKPLFMNSKPSIEDPNETMNMEDQDPKKMISDSDFIYSTLFEEYDNIHQLWKHLQISLPTILYKPIKTVSESNDIENDLNDLKNAESFRTSNFYSSDFQLVATSASTFNDQNTGSMEKETTIISEISENSDGNGDKEIILLSSRKELETVSTSLTLATSIAKRASDFINSASTNQLGNANPKTTSSSSFELPIVNCSFYFRPSLSLMEMPVEKTKITNSEAFYFESFKSSSISKPIFKKIYISWSVTLPSLLSDTLFKNNSNQASPGLTLNLKPPIISGVSQLVLKRNPNSNSDLQISKHKLLNVKVDGRTVPLTTIAEVLLRIRQFAQSSSVATAASSILPTFESLFSPDQREPNLSSSSSSSPFSSFFKEIREGLVSPLFQNSIFETSSSFPDIEPPLIALLMNSYSFTCNYSSLQFAPDDIMGNNTFIIPIDNAFILPNSTNSFDTSIPFPGSIIWQKYASFFHHITRHFLPNTIPTLSSSTKRKKVAVLFSEDVTFKAIDGSVILSSANDVAQFYTTLSLLRNAASSVPGFLSTSPLSSTSTLSITSKSSFKWEIRNVSIIKNENGDYKNVLVSWKSTFPILLPVPLPDNISTKTPTKVKKGGSQGSSTLIPVYGKDLFTLELDENMPNNHYIITSIQQKELKVNENVIDNPETWKTMVNTISQMDGQKFLTYVNGGGETRSGRTLLSAIELITDIWDVAATPNPFNSSSTLIAKSLTDKAAASVYNLMIALHSDIPTLLDHSSSALYNKVVPAEEFLTNDIKLKGYLEETFSRDINSYRQAIGFSLSTLRTAFRLNRVVVEKGKKISTSVELTSIGDVQLKVKLPLRVKSLIDFDGLRNNDGMPGSLPLTIELVSIYKINLNGKIFEHDLKEARINGVLTPADVVSRWMREMINGSAKGFGDFGNQNYDGDASLAIPNILDNPLLNTLFDAMDWRRSMNN